MRLSKEEQQAIKRVVASLDPNAKVYLFGSRANEKKRGGDIDLLIISKLIKEQDRRLLRLKLFDQLGEQKIDLVISDDTSKPFVRIALEEGELL